MSDLKKSLSHKYGPLPLWGWLGTVVGFVLYRRGMLHLRRKSQQGASQGQSYVSGASAGPNLDYVPGGSIPQDFGGASASDPGNGDTSGLMNLLTMLVASRNNGTAPNAGPGSTVHTAPTPGKRGGHKKKHAHKHKPKTKPSKHPRGHAGLRHPNGGRTKGHTKSHTKKPKHAIDRQAVNHPSFAILRSRPKVGLVGSQPQATQRALATHPVAHAMPERRNPPRPSNPPRRTLRSVRH